SGPTILGAPAEFGGPENKPISFKINAVDLEGDPSDYAVDLVGDSTPGSLVRNHDMGTFTPRKNLTGAVRLFVGVSAVGAVRRGYVQNPYDTQQIQIGVGDLPASGNAVVIDALAGQSIGKTSLAIFRDSD